MPLMIGQTLGLWLLAGIAFWAGFLALGLRFSEDRSAPTRPMAVAMVPAGLRAVLALGAAMWLWSGWG